MGKSERQSVEVGRLPSVGDVIRDRYRLEEIVATGGMGVIMRARQLAMDRDVAIKLLHPHMASEPDTVARFEREVDLAKHLSHPHTIQLFDFGETDEGALYIVMEYLQGEDLKYLLRREGALSVDRALEIGLQTLDGLAEAHDMNIIHRDLKPSNIFILEQRRGGDFVKVLDFGVAKSLEEAQGTLTKTGQMCGTPMYMPPEIALKKSSDKSVDVYAIGLILLEMLIGRRVFDGESMAQTLLMQLQTSIPLPEPLKSTRLGQVIQRATAKHPDERYRHADAMLDALEEAAEAVPEGLTIEPSDVPNTEDPDGSNLFEGVGLGGGEPELTNLRRTDDETSSEALPEPESTPPPERQTRVDVSAPDHDPDEGEAFASYPTPDPGDDLPPADPTVRVDTETSNDPTVVLDNPETPNRSTSTPGKAPTPDVSEPGSLGGRAEDAPEGTSSAERRATDTLDEVPDVETEEQRLEDESTGGGVGRFLGSAVFWTGVGLVCTGAAIVGVWLLFGGGETRIGEAVTMTATSVETDSADAPDPTPGATPDASSGSNDAARRADGMSADVTDPRHPDRAEDEPRRADSPPADDETSAGSRDEELPSGSRPPSTDDAPPAVGTSGESTGARAPDRGDSSETEGTSIDETSLAPPAEETEDDAPVDPSGSQPSRADDSDSTSDDSESDLFGSSPGAPSSETEPSGTETPSGGGDDEAVSANQGSGDSPESGSDDSSDNNEGTSSDDTIDKTLEKFELE